MRSAPSTLSAGIVAGLRSGLEAAGAGDGAALAGYDKRVQRRFIDYLNGRREQYSLEAHWPDSPSCRRQEDARITLHKGGSHGAMED